MSIKNFLDYESYIKLQDRQLKIWGQPCTIYHPTNKTALGYEDTNLSEIQMMDSDKVLANNYVKSEGRIWINFTIEKKVFYKFNWFPDDADELCSAFMNSDSNLREGDYIRTAITEATSIWGTLTFVVVKIVDEGFSQILKRTYFLKPTNNADLEKELSF